MEHAIRWMISAPGLVTEGMFVFAACALIYARFRYVETHLATADRFIPGIDDTTPTDEWLPPEPEQTIVHERPKTFKEWKASRPKTLEEWLAWDELSDAAEDMYWDTRTIDTAYAIMVAGQIATCQATIVKLGTTEDALREDTAEHQLSKLRADVKEIRSEKVPA